VFVVADSDQREVEQPHDQRQHALARQAVPPEVGVHLLTDARQRVAKQDHAVELRLAADLVPAGVVDVLLAALVVAARGQNVPVEVVADPHVRPSGRDGQRLVAATLVRAGDTLAIRADVGEPPAPALALDARLALLDVSQVGGIRRLDGVGENLKYLVRAPAIRIAYSTSCPVFLSTSLLRLYTGGYRGRIPGTGRAALRAALTQAKS